MSGQKYKPYNNALIEFAIAELNAYRVRKQQIIRLNERRMNLEHEIYVVKAVDYSKAPVQGGKFKDMVVETAVKWADLVSEIEEITTENEREMNIIEEKLRYLSFDEQQVIVLYYLNGKNMTETAIAMDRSVDGLKKLKRRALIHYAEVKL